MEIGEGVDVLARRGRRQSQPQAKGRDDALTTTKPRFFATGVEEGFGKHPLEFGGDHAQLLVIHLHLLWLYLKPHTEEECRIDRNKSKINQILKSYYLCCIARSSSVPETCNHSQGEFSAIARIHPGHRTVRALATSLQHWTTA